MAQEPTASAYLSVVDRFTALGVPVSLDPTIRRSLISDEATYLDRLLRLAEKVSVLKVSDEEIAFLTRVDDPDEGISLLRVPVGSLVIVTLGANGAAIYRDGEKLVSVPGFSVKVVETTGCGDAFMGAILAQLAGKTAKEIASMTPEQLQPIARFANAAAAIVATRYGAADANPTRAEVETFLASAK